MPSYSHPELGTISTSTNEEFTRPWYSKSLYEQWLESKGVKDNSAFGGSLGEGVIDTGNALLEQYNALYQQAAQEQRDFEQSSAREAMAFEAEQAQMNRDFQQSSAREAMAFEADQAKISRDWQEQMSNTAYQRAVADLRAAGLNPALAYQQGGAASTSGATAAGHVSSGSSASGHKSSGSKSEVSTALLDIVKAYINQSTDIVSSLIRTF